ncbi:hypothetical protein C2I18_26370 [Paenibacillus sp. PK3_47]|uniref:cupin domain-containing protein n=1 Tax=Paenibacillus sp. PK3_47 TaxID=2072642 RepID=UPI00201D4ED8|nr:cupin domain-containing protein [Paenibacillus sp. PK3_47]UQZ36747.1 hypothetical protein C2I18_26370 [Paenibacillus sp. PK3_47]
MTKFQSAVPKAEAAVKTFMFKEDGLLPNNPKLPAVLYPGVLKEQPEHIRQLFNDNGWLNSWEDGVFPYHHYHSNAHEVLGGISGTALVQIGGDSGATFEISPGDVLVLPAGTAHKSLSSSDDFLVAGAYPGGMQYNTRRAAPEDWAEGLPEIGKVPLPLTDPVYGDSGPLLKAWRAES